LEYDKKQNIIFTNNLKNMYITQGLPLTRFSRSCNIINFFSWKFETANVEMQDEMDPNENRGITANLREIKLLDTRFSVVSINTLPVHEYDMQNSPIKCYLIPCICLEILCLTL
jgi:hypothetical protein